MYVVDARVYLHDGDASGVEPTRPEVDGGGEVVAVHHAVHDVVHAHEVQPRGGPGGVGVPAEEQHRDVVVPAGRVCHTV